MTIDTAQDGNDLTIRVSGRFDFSLHKDFRSASEQITANIRQVKVDLGRAEYVDSSALGMLLILRDKMGGDKSSVRITNVSPEVRKILEIANFNQLFTLA